MSTVAVTPPGTGAPVVQDPTGFRLPSAQRALIRWNIYIGFAALTFGVAHGLSQALSYAGIDILRFFPGLKNYYQGLTVHGVMNAIVLTFAFSNGFLALTTARALGRPLHGGLLHAALWVLVAGVVAASYAMFTGSASVLYTFYPPLQAHWAYYLGLALMVVSTWLTAANLFVTYGRWRADNRGERVPLLAHMSIATYAMWVLASLGIAVEVVGFLLPWSLGLIEGVDPLFSRTLFWFSGHPIVYFWLLPVYVSWYGMVPRHAGGRIISDPLVRVAFVLFLLLSIPTGFHHQYADPGIPASMKAVHAVMTFGVFFPSLLTAFTVVAALEMGGRRHGGRGIIGWFFKLPWGDPVLAAQVLAMLTFVLGGITGLINASYNVNQVVHNTTWVPGHFHMTVGSAVALSFMGIAYWLVPWLKGRELWGRRLAVVQAWTYFIGVLIFARGMISGGLDGMPRRTFMAAAPYSKESWQLSGILTGVGGSIMTLGAVLFFLVLLGTIFLGRKAAERDIPFAESLAPPARSGWETRLDDFRLWVIVAIALIAFAYGPFLVQYLPPRLASPPFRLF